MKPDFAAMLARFRERARTSPLGDRSALDTGLKRMREALGPLGAASAPAPAAAEISPGGRFEWRTHTGRHGAREYRLYIPAGAAPRGVLLMLHGCTQTPDDFAAGAAMNRHAERHGLIVAYPAQPRTQNPQGCWNWFRPGDQRRDGGEAALLTELAGALQAEFAVGGGAVFAAGLSAGGAMAAVLGDAYPEVFAAVGVHSGLPAGCAHDAPSALQAMRGAPAPEPARPPPGQRRARTIIFHGGADATVHPVNGARIAERARAGLIGAEVEQTSGVALGGRRYRQTVVRVGRIAALEHWLIEDAGHAWSGGSPAGSYTDPSGPDASAEMVRFFLEP